MEVFPNWTAIPVIFFLILLTYILNRAFFRPMAQALEERHRRIGGAQKEAEEIRRTSQERIAEFDQRMREARREADQQMAQARNEALGEKSGILSVKRTEAEKMITEGREEIRRKTEEARKTLESESKSFAYQIASQILNRQVSQKK